MRAESFRIKIKDTWGFQVQTSATGGNAELFVFNSKVRAVQVQNSFGLYDKRQAVSRKDQSLKLALSLHFSESVQASE